VEIQETDQASIRESCRDRCYCMRITRNLFVIFDYHRRASSGVQESAEFLRQTGTNSGSSSMRGQEYENSQESHQSKARNRARIISMPVSQQQFST
jgi:hypothetical protein